MFMRKRLGYRKALKAKRVKPGKQKQAPVAPSNAERYQTPPSSANTHLLHGRYNAKG